MSMDSSLIEKIAREAAEEGFEIMSLHGVGEPLLRKDLREILALLTKLGVWRGWMTSNGTLLTPERAASLYEVGLRGLYISIDTLDADMYKRTRGGKLPKVIENIRKTAKAHPGITFMVGLMEHKEQTKISPELIELFYETFDHLPNISHHVAVNFRFPGAAEDWQIGSAEAALLDSCTQMAYHYTIDAEGRVALCCVDQNTEHVLGNVTQRRIKDIWFDRDNQETFRNIFLGLSGCPGVCYKCVLKKNQRSLADVDPALTLPYTQIELQASAALEAGEMNRAKGLYEHLFRLDPWNTELQSFIRETFSSKEKHSFFRSEANEIQPAADGSA